MIFTVSPGSRTGAVRIPASKSQAHRLLICAALGKRPVSLRCDALNADILATVECLRALGADIVWTEETLRVKPIRTVPDALCTLPCGESGSTLRFLLPVAGALGANAVFLREGRLPERPLEPLLGELSHGGMSFREDGARLFCSGALSPGSYTLPGNISSQYITAMLLALPLLPGDSTLAVTGKRESEGYIAMTEDALRLSGIRLQKRERTYTISGGQTARLPAQCHVEGDWSNAAFFLCMGALSPAGVTVTGLASDSSQGDRAVLDVLRRFGADVRETQDAVTVRRGALRGVTIDAAPIPDLIPVLSVVAALADGQTQVVNAARLRLKESDRLESTAAMLRALGAQVEVHDSGLTVTGRKVLTGGTVDPQHDHRIAMAAAAAASGSTAPVTVRDCACTDKSYPRFWTDLSALKTVPAAENTELE